VIALGLEKFSLVGHSMGGAIANLFAGIYREHVDNVVAIEGIGIWKNPDNLQKFRNASNFGRKRSMISTKKRRGDIRLLTRLLNEWLQKPRNTL